MLFDPLLDLLADKQFHSGESLGVMLGISRAAVWKRIQKLELLGVEIDSVHGKGYRLNHEFELLSADKILRELSSEAKKQLSDLEIFLSVDSTNAHAMRQTNKDKFVCLAEQQTAGRGRRGRNWISPFGRNIYMSLCWHFQGGAAQLEGLSLAVAVAVVKALEACGVKNLNVKWPNDLLCQGRKLAGILLEMSGDADGVCRVVIGIGVNINMEKSGADIDQPWIDTMTVTGRSISRNELAGNIINQLVFMLKQFQYEGFSSFKTDWMEKDFYFDKLVSLSVGENRIEGVEKGVDDRGALCLETESGVQKFHGGEISLRLL